MNDKLISVITESHTNNSEEIKEKTSADLELEQLEQLDKPEVTSEISFDTSNSTNENTNAIAYELPIHPQEHFEKNCSYFDKFPYFRNICYCAAATHEFGNAKYKKYSWQNNPEESYATSEVNFDALVRHLVLYKTKSAYTSLDESGMNHMVHVAGRCHMLVTNFYREMLFNENNPRPIYKDIRPILDTFRNTLDDNYSSLLAGKSDQISAEIRMSILKAPMTIIDFIKQEDIDVEDKRETLLTTMLEICDYITVFKLFNSLQLAKTITSVDHLFYCAAAYCHLTPSLIDSADIWMKNNGHKE